MSVSFSVNTDSGLIVPARQCPSVNQDERPDGAEPELLVVHGISLPPGEFGGGEIEQLFSNSLNWDSHPYFAEIRGVEVSSHLLIRRDGELIQFVPFGNRAWHAGESSFQGRTCCNDFSIGIELEGDDDTPYTDSQYEVLIAVTDALLLGYPALSVRQIAAHSDISPGRKTDPGPAFDWLRLYDGVNQSRRT
ncbi:MAG: 1,6-anhydro-N-acetylmuramyl-L-alanine amidase AmpD [Gammaproteobacteria bacterium]|jgi:AmpD protein|nr:1,6-anhydro-N-acetylmuramyl-L-alanine amidase AmpD [Gammaproteobacteria bacterium]MDH3749006.1 1,6-anhydro-N-acetylmuramyl-L-alanine amidase AmpD [Gammaproteobacteria bacterium]MDH3804466.1 1,6-anhydro-N-acetylmuramyl-L-alanine amidase AmpD [Gammaproteobacteria bacterium]